MKLGKPFLTVQCSGSYTKTLEVVEYIGLNTLQTGLGGFDAVSVDTKGQVFGFDETVVASGQLILQHRGCIPRGYCQRHPSGAGMEMELAKVSSDAARFKKTAGSESSCRNN